MSQYAIIDASGNVINTVELEAAALLPTTSTDPETGETVDVPASWVPPENCTAVPCTNASIGWTYANGAFVEPTPQASTLPAPTPSPLSALAQLLISKGLISQADVTAAEAQDGVTFGQEPP